MTLSHVRGVCELVHRVYSFARSELDRCWTCCLPAVYDLLSWVVTTWAAFDALRVRLTPHEQVARMHRTSSLPLCCWEGGEPHDMCTGRAHEAADVVQNSDCPYAMHRTTELFSHVVHVSCADEAKASVELCLDSTEEAAACYALLQRLHTLVSVPEIIRVMFAHADEVGARQYTRLRTRAFAVVQEAAGVASGAVRRVLMDTLGLRECWAGTTDESSGAAMGGSVSTLASTSCVEVHPHSDDNTSVEARGSGVCVAAQHMDSSCDTRAAMCVCADRRGRPTHRRWLTVVGDGETHREIFFAAVTASLALLGGDVATRWSWLADVLVSIAVLCNTGRDDEENESTWACTESRMQSWPAELRMTYPAAVRLADVGRAMALSTLLSCCAPNEHTCDTLYNSNNNHHHHRYYYFDNKHDSDNSDNQHVCGHGTNRGSANSAGQHNDDEDKDTEKAEAVLAPAAGRAVWLTWHLLAMHEEDAILTHEPCMPRSHTHRARVRLWQLMCALLPCMPHTRAVWQPILHHVLHVCMTRTNLGSVRHWMEVYVIRVLVRQPSLYRLLDTALARYDLRPQVCGSYILVACHVLEHYYRPSKGNSNRSNCDTCACARTPHECDAGVPHDSNSRGCDYPSHACLFSVPDSEEVYEALMRRVLQYSSSHQHLLRIISHIGLCRICEARRAVGAALSPELVTLYDSLTHTEEHRRLRQKHEAALFFDSAAATQPRELFCRQQFEGDGLVCDALPAALFERVRFIESEMASLTATVLPVEWLRLRHGSVSRVTLLAQLPQRWAALSLIPHTACRTECTVDYTAEAVAFLCADPREASSSLAGTAAANGTGAALVGSDENTQQKVTAWWVSEIYNELHPRALRHTRQPFVVVGSLLENPVNIAGLCRCAEIFSIERVVVPDAKVFKHPHFIAAARSAELWTPWEAVGARDVPAFLTRMRVAGYTIIGVEQTVNSVSMARYAFPERAVVVLGAEGQGIPAPLIPQLDVCIEIPQYGLIRSLNVHVAGAIVMYEYTKQHRMGAEL